MHLMCKHRIPHDCRPFQRKQPAVVLGNPQNSSIVLECWKWATCSRYMSFLWVVTQVNDTALNALQLFQAIGQILLLLRSQEIFPVRRHFANRLQFPLLACSIFCSKQITVCSERPRLLILAQYTFSLTLSQRQDLKKTYPHCTYQKPSTIVHCIMCTEIKYQLTAPMPKRIRQDLVPHDIHNQDFHTHPFDNVNWKILKQLHPTHVNISAIELSQKTDVGLRPKDPYQPFPPFLLGIAHDPLPIMTRPHCRTQGRR